MVSNQSRFMAAIILANLVVSGCAGRNTREASLGHPSATSGHWDDGSVSRSASEVEFHDPLSELDVARPSTSAVHGYQRFVTARLNGVTESWHRQRRDRWNTWAIGHLRDGDLVFLQSKGNMILGVIDFSKLIRDVTESNFTHMGIVAIEHGEVFVYDTVLTGPERKTFGQMMTLPDIEAVAVRRLRPEYQSHVPGAVDYCRRVHQHQIGFDKKFRLDNDDLYCTEMVELAFRSTGLPLSQPLRWSSLPGIEKHPISINAVRLASDIKLDEFAVVPGNDQIGIWASPLLELVLDLTDAESPPAAPASPSLPTMADQGPAPARLPRLARLPFAAP